ncbi:MAG: flagellin [Pseudomonadota bacterium]
MPQIINTNIMSLNAQRNLNTSQNALKISLQRLSSGLRINSARDDAAGLAIVERFSSQIRGLSRAELNANDGVSLAQVAEGGLQEAGNILQRVRELAVQSINATNSSSDRQSLNAEVSQLTAELERIARSSEFNGQKILDGTFGTAFFQVGANANQTIVMSTGNFTTANYGDYRVLGYGSTVASTTVSTSTRATTGTLIITSPLGIATIATANGQSAGTIANNINLYTPTTGVEAFGETNAQLAFSSSGAYVFTMLSRNTTASTLSFNLTANTGVDALTSASTAINQFTATTGVVAEVKSDGTAIILHSYTGDNIQLNATAYTNAGTVTMTGLDINGTVAGGTNTASLTSSAGTAGTMLVEGQVYFDSDKSFTVQSGLTFTGWVISAASEASLLQQVANLDVSSVNAAKLALTIADSALQQISSQRAKFGALQSRFDSTIRNIQTSVENMSGARSRIQDADFAVETAALSRAQILQQAGTAMLAQANTSQQNVLSLLR